MALIGSQEWPAINGLYTSFAVEHKAQGKEAGCNEKKYIFMDHTVQLQIPIFSLFARSFSVLLSTNPSISK